MQTDSVKCSNCKAMLNRDKLQLHESYCLRFNVWCDKCSQVYDKRTDAEHQQLHLTEACSICGNQIEKLHTESHLKQCRTQFECQYCSNIVSKDKHVQHLIECGSRTDVCELCRLPVKKSDALKHDELCIKFDAKLLESQSKRSVFEDSSYVASSVAKSESSITKLERYMALKKEACAKGKPGSNTALVAKTPEKRHFKSPSKRRYQKSPDKPNLNQEDSDLEWAILRSLMDN